MTPTAEEAFGKVLRELRRTRGFSQENLAFECGVHRTYISLLERGIKAPSLNTLLRLADALNVRASHVMQRVEEILSEEKQL